MCGNSCVSTCIHNRASKEAEDRIAALEAKVRELEAENSVLSEKAGRYQAIYDVACQGRDASRQQVERLVEALKRAERKLSAYVGVCTGDKELTDTILPMASEALAAVEKERENGGSEPTERR